jgi:hypothetical protein
MIGSLINFKIYVYERGGEDENDLFQHTLLTTKTHCLYICFIFIYLFIFYV